MRRITNPAELVQAMRARCTMRLAELAAFRDGAGPTGAAPGESASYRSRWRFTSHLLYHVEELPDDVGQLGELQEILELSIEAAQEDADGGAARRTDSSSAILGSAVASEAEFARAWLEAPKVPRGGFPHVPDRRVLDHDTYAKMWRPLSVKFPDVKRGPAGAEVPWGTDLARVAAILLKKGIDTVYLVHPKDRASSFVASATLLPMKPEEGAPHYFPPRGTYLTSRDCDFHVFVPNAGPPHADGWIAKKLRGA